MKRLKIVIEGDVPDENRLLLFEMSLNEIQKLIKLMEKKKK